MLIPLHLPYSDFLEILVRYPLRSPRHGLAHEARPFFFPRLTRPHRQPIIYRVYCRPLPLMFGESISSCSCRQNTVWVRQYFVSESFVISIHSPKLQNRRTKKQYPGNSSRSPSTYRVDGTQLLGDSDNHLTDASARRYCSRLTPDVKLIMVSRTASSPLSGR
jgi:hypothetical protein